MSSKKKNPQGRKDEADKIAVFLCNCGSNIADTIDVESLRQRYEKEGIPLVDVDDHLCSEQGVYDLIEKIRKRKVKRVVIAGCSPLLHRELFSDAMKEAGIDPNVILPSSVALANLWKELPSDEHEPFAVVDFGESETSLCIVHNGSIRYGRAWAQGSSALTQTIQDGLRLSGTLAREKKEREALPPA